MKLEDFKSTNDPPYNFFLVIVPKTPKMPPASQHLVRTKIFEVVSQTEASLLNIPQPPFEEPQLQTPRYYDLTDISLNSYSSGSGSSLTTCHESGMRLQLDLLKIAFVWQTSTTNSQNNFAQLYQQYQGFTR